MKKTIRLTESELKQLVKKSVTTILCEGGRSKSSLKPSNIANHNLSVGYSQASHDYDKNYDSMSKQRSDDMDSYIDQQLENDPDYTQKNGNGIEVGRDNMKWNSEIDALQAIFNDIQHHPKYEYLSPEQKEKIMDVLSGDKDPENASDWSWR